MRQLHYQWRLIMEEDMTDYIWQDEENKKYFEALPPNERQQYRAFCVSGGKEGEPGFFYFDMSGLSDSEVKRVFPRGYDSERYHVGGDRIIQNYLEARNFEVRLVSLPVFADLPNKQVVKIDHLFFSSTDHCLKVVLHEWRARLKDLAGNFGPVSEINVDIQRIYKDVVTRVMRHLQKTEKDLIKISETSRYLWPRLSKNMAGAIHNWMLKGKKEQGQKPVFVPHEYISEPKRTGCRLSVADQVTVGLLYSLFSCGIRYSPFTTELIFSTFFNYTPGE